MRLNITEELVKLKGQSESYNLKMRSEGIEKRVNLQWSVGYQMSNTHITEALYGERGWETYLEK